MSSMRLSLKAGMPLSALVSCWDQDKLQPLVKRTTSSGSHSDKITAGLAACAMSMQHVPDPAEEEILRRTKFRRQEHLTEKLQWIYKILCGLTNMRNKDLKTLVPLTSGFVNIIMMDTEKANICLKNWYKFGLRRKAGLEELETETGDLPPWLNLLDESFAYEKKPQKPKHRHDMVERVRAEFMDVQRSRNDQLERYIYEHKMHMEQRMATGLIASRIETIQPTLNSSLKNELRESKSVFWYGILKRDGTELVDESNYEYRTILQKISQFHNLHKLPYAKEKFCLLVFSFQIDQLFRPAMQDALMFVTKDVLQLQPQQLTHWFQYLKLPFYDLSF